MGKGFLALHIINKSATAIPKEYLIAPCMPKIKKGRTSINWPCLFFFFKYIVFF